MATAKARDETQTIEEGDIFFFYRPRVEAEKVRGREDVRRFYMVLAPKRPRKLYRLFVLGRKKLPEVIPGVQHPERRNWALNVLASEDPEDIRRALMAEEYETETRGERLVGAAKPVGEGKYKLVWHRNHTELAYVLELPKEPGPAQEEFEIKKEASYVVAVKNPEVSVPGLPAPKEPPAYPKELRENFGSRRWIDVLDPALLDYEHTQLLLLGAHAGDVKEELGIEIDEEDETLSTAEVCRELRLSCEREAVKPLLTGEFPDKELPERAEEVRRLSEEESPTRAGKIGGKAAATRAPSAAAIAKVLGGIDFPASKAELLEHARRNRDRVADPEAVLAVIARLPDRRYTSMADVEVEVGKVLQDGTLARSRRVAGGSRR